MIKIEIGKVYDTRVKERVLIVASDSVHYGGFKRFIGMYLNSDCATAYNENGYYFDEYTKTCRDLIALSEDQSHTGIEITSENING